MINWSNLVAFKEKLWEFKGFTKYFHRLVILLDLWTSTTICKVKTKENIHYVWRPEPPGLSECFIRVSSEDAAYEPLSVISFTYNGGKRIRNTFHFELNSHCQYELNKRRFQWSCKSPKTCNAHIWFTLVLSYFLYFSKLLNLSFKNCHL